MVQTLGAKRKGSGAIYIALALLIPFASSLINPVLSLFFTLELKFSPLNISAFFIALPVMTVILVQFIGKLSDHGLQRPLIITLSSVCGVAGMFFLMLRPGFYVMLSAGLLWLSLSAAAFPQIFASAREYSAGKRDPVMFTAFLRSLCSLAWTGGPPLAYFIAMGHSFDLLFLLSALMYAFGAAASFVFLPSLRTSGADLRQSAQSPFKNRSVVLLFISCMGLCTAFNSYIVTMPLYVTQELKLDENLPGFMMGLAAFLEIPIMLFSAKLSKRTGLKSLMAAGAVSLIVFLALMNFVKSPQAYMFMQFLSASFIALMSGMGMVYFQEMLPHIPGQATSLFINSGTAGQIAGGALIALAALGSYRYIFAAGAAIAFLSLALLLLVKKPLKRTLA